MQPGSKARSPAVWVALALIVITGVVVGAASTRRDAAETGAAETGAAETGAAETGAAESGAADRGEAGIVAEGSGAAIIAAPSAHPPHPLAQAPATLADASRLVSIEMYSAAWCQACGRAKTWMREQGITYHEVDVDRRAGALAQLQMLNPRSSLPTFDIDGHVVVGFEEARLRTAIDDAARRQR